VGDIEIEPHPERVHRASWLEQDRPVDPRPSKQSCEALAHRAGDDHRTESLGVTVEPVQIGSLHTRSALLNDAL
jgi:hypothetical protein